MYKAIYAPEELQNYLSGAIVAAFDFETAPDEKYRKEDKAALDAHKSHIVGISFSVAENDGIYMPLTHRTGKNAEGLVEIWTWLAAFFTNPAIIKVAHNLAFESAFLYARGIVIQEPVYDTIAAAQLIYKNETEFRSLADCGLKTIVPEYFGEQLPTFAETVGNRHFDELDSSADATIRYACADADYALQLYHELNRWFDRFLPKHRFIVEKVESPTAVYVGIMRYNGLPIDRQLMEQKRTEAEKKLVELKGKIAFIIGDINIGANALRTVANKLRNYYNLPAYAWVNEIIPGRTQVRDWPFHILELRAAVQGIVDKINSFDSTSDDNEAAPVDWIDIGTGRPRADVMSQLMGLILQL